MGKGVDDHLPLVQTHPETPIDSPRVAVSYSNVADVLVDEVKLKTASEAGDNFS